MEIFELAWVGIEFCGCMLDFLVIFSNGTAAYSGVKTLQNRKHRREQLANGEAPEPKTPLWPFAVLVFAAVFFTGLMVFKYTRR